MAKKKTSGNLMGKVKIKRTGGASPRREGSSGSPVGTGNTHHAPKGKHNKA